jgi:DNA-binding transcriptional ArsR family regulator
MPDTDVFDAISSPVRRRLLDLLVEGPRSVVALTDEFAVSRPAISQHLKILLTAGLVHEERVGRERHYSLDARPLRGVNEWTAHYERFWTQRLARLSELLDEA